MPNPSPVVLAQNGSGSFLATQPRGLNVTGGNTITFQLASYAGVNRGWSIVAYGYDDLTLQAPPAQPAFVPGSPDQFTYVYPAATGRAILFRSVVNRGQDVNGVVQDDYSTTFGLFTTVGGSRVFATAERLESDPAGWIADINNFIRSGGGVSVTFGGDLATVDATHQKVVGIAGLPIDLSTTSAIGQSKVFVGDSTAVKNVYRQLTSDDIAAGFSIVISGVGGGLLEIGSTWTPGTNVAVAPAPNSAGLTAMSIHDSDGGSTSILGGASPVATPSATYTKSTPGQFVDVTVTGTKGGINKTSNALRETWGARIFYGFGTNAVPTALNAVGAGATLVGPTASMSSVLSNGLQIGATGIIGQITPASNFFWIAWDSAYGNAHVLYDFLSNFQIDMFPTVYSIVFNTGTGVPRTAYVMRSQNDLGTHNIQPYFFS